MASGPLPPAANVLRVRLTWSDFSDPLAQTIHFFKYGSGTPSSANCATMASSAVSTAETAFAALAAVSSVGVSEAQVTDLSSASAGQGSGGTPWLGTRSGEPLSPGTAIVVQHQIGRRYRGGKPRSYLPLGVAEDLTSGFWSNSFVSDVDTAWGSWVSAMEGAGAGCTIENLVNVSYYEGFTPMMSPTTGRWRNVPNKRGTPQVDEVLGHTTSRVIGSQRRRNRDQ